MAHQKAHYGMQLISSALGGKIKKISGREYGDTSIRVIKKSSICPNNWKTKTKIGQFAPNEDINARGQRGEGDGRGDPVYCVVHPAGVGGGGLSRADAV